MGWGLGNADSHADARTCEAPLAWERPWTLHDGADFRGTEVRTGYQLPRKKFGPLVGIPRLAGKLAVTYGSGGDKSYVGYYFQVTTRGRLKDH